MKTINYKQVLLYLFVSSFILYSSLETLNSISFVDKTVDLQEVPSKVRSIINDRLQNGELVSLSLNNEKHGLHYDAIIRIDNATESLEISPLGKIIDKTVLFPQNTIQDLAYNSSTVQHHESQKSTVPSFTIPSSILAQVQQQYPNALLEQKEQSKDGHYKLVLNYQGSVVECIYQANGHLDTLKSYSPAEYLR